jgi:hypothetical protein
MKILNGLLKAMLCNKTQLSQVGYSCVHNIYEATRRVATVGQTDRRQTIKTQRGVTVASNKEKFLPSDLKEHENSYNSSVQK